MPCFERVSVTIEWEFPSWVTAGPTRPVEAGWRDAEETDNCGPSLCAGQALEGISLAHLLIPRRQEFDPYILIMVIPELFEEFDHIVKCYSTCFIHFNCLSWDSVLHCLQL